MCSTTITIFLVCALYRTVLSQVAEGENLSHAEAAILPYSLKTATGKDSSERYTLFAVKPSNSQADEQPGGKGNHINTVQNQRDAEDVWDRISLHYKNQLTQVNPPIDEFGYYNPNSVEAHNGPADVYHFGSGAVTAPLPLALVLIINLGMLLYLFVGIMSTISASAASGFNLRLPNHMYPRRYGPYNNYN